MTANPESARDPRALRYAETMRVTADLLHDAPEGSAERHYLDLMGLYLAAAFGQYLGDAPLADQLAATLVALAASMEEGDAPLSVPDER